MTSRGKHTCTNFRMRLASHIAIPLCCLNLVPAQRGLRAASPYALPSMLASEPATYHLAVMHRAYGTYMHAYTWETWHACSLDPPGTACRRAWPSLLAG